MDQCKKKYANINSPKTVRDIENFCELLTSNKVKDSKKAFVKLPPIVQCMFLHYAWNILSKKSKYSEDSYMTAFYLFKLFRGKDMKDKDIYSKYSKLKTLEKMYKTAREWNRKSPTSSSPVVPKQSKKYEKEYQRYEAPQDTLDPLYVYYTSLYLQNPKSPLAITWLTEHGVYEGPDRQKISKLYKKLAEAGKLIK